MNIAFFTNNYLPNPYGVTTSIESFRRGLEKTGNKVFVFAPRYDNYKDKSKKIFRYPSIDINYKIKFPLPIPYSVEIEKKLESMKIDIIHSQHPNLLGAVAWRWSKKKNVPIVFTWHTIYDKYTHYAPIIPQKFSSYWAIRNSVNYANKVDKIIIPTESVREIIKKWGVKNDNIEVVATGVDEDNFRNPQGDRIRELLGIEKNKKIILSISRLTEEKNVIFLVREIIKVLKDNPEIVFVLGGDGYLKDELVKIINESGVGEKVFFAGLLERTEVKDYMKAADVFVYASRSETQGTIITEAMYMGLPIVAVNSSGVGDLIIDGKTGILVSSEENNFSKELLLLLGDEKRMTFLGKNAQKEAMNNYTSRACAAKIMGIYQELIAQHSK